MAKLFTPENLAKENFEKRKKAFLAEVDLLGTKYEIYVHAIIEAQNATNPDTKETTLVYVPKINIVDRRNIDTKAPDEPKETPKEVKGD